MSPRPAALALLACLAPAPALLAEVPPIRVGLLRGASEVLVQAVGADLVLVGDPGGGAETITLGPDVTPTKRLDLLGRGLAGGEGTPEGENECYNENGEAQPAVHRNLPTNEFSLCGDDGT